MNSVNDSTKVYDSLGLSTQQPSSRKDNLKIDDFMHLMVTELTHQDPFKPMDNKDLATQVSQFATVSGIGQLNDSFSGLSSTLTSDQALQATGLVGHEVLVSGNQGWLSQGGVIKGSIDLPKAASNIRLRITDGNGALVRELQLGSHDAGQLAFDWDGYDDNGDPVPAGRYQLSVQASVDGADMAPNLLVAAQVGSVSMGAGDGVRLNLEGLGQVSVKDVMQIH